MPNARSRLRRLAAQPPALATRNVMAGTAATFLIVIGLAGCVFAAILPDNADESDTILLGMSIASAAAGLLVVLLGKHLGTGVHFAIILLSAIALTILVARAPNAVAAVSMTTLYSCIACHAGFVFSWARAAFVVAFTVPFATIGVMSRSDLPAWAALVPTVSIALVGGAVAVLSRLATEAESDSLTGLPNRRAFDRLIAAATSDARNTKPQLALILLDLDRFARINDTLGHRAGDAVLAHVASSWSERLPPGAVLARYGGDEFALLLPETSERDAMEFADELRRAVSTECSAGVTSWRPGDTASLFAGRADTGLYRAKSTGRGRVVLESALRPAVVEELRRAIAADAVALHYQPIVDVPAGGRVVGYEALVRWTSASQPGITATGVVEIAESHGLIRQLGSTVLRRACRDGAALEEADEGGPLVLNVNVSGLEVDAVDYAERVLAILTETGWSPQQLTLELTESQLTADAGEGLAQIARLRDAGVRVAIDDFGSGYSSLNRLVALPADVLKLDRPVIGSGDAAKPMIEAMLALARSFGLELVVEGIETSAQHQLLLDLGVCRAQGYFYGGPRPAPIPSATGVDHPAVT